MRWVMLAGSLFGMIFIGLGMFAERLSLEVSGLVVWVSVVTNCLLRLLEDRDTIQAYAERTLPPLPARQERR